MRGMLTLKLSFLVQSIAIARPTIAHSVTADRCACGISAPECPLMGWSGRAPAPPAREAGKGRQRRGARHVTQAQCWNRRDRYRYRQELVSRRGSRSAWRDCPTPEVVARPSRNTARQPAAVSNRHGGLRRRTPSEPQTHIAWSQRSAHAGEVRAPVFEGTEERLPRCRGDRRGGATANNEVRRDQDRRTARLAGAAPRAGAFG